MTIFFEIENIIQLCMVEKKLADLWITMYNKFYDIRNTLLWDQLVYDYGPKETASIETQIELLLMQ